MNNDKKDNFILTCDHYSRAVELAVRKICRPLLRLGITYFAYARVFYNETVFGLVTNWDSFYHQYTQQYAFSPPVSKLLLNKKIHYMPFTLQYRDYPVIRDYRELYDVDLPIYFIEYYQHYSDLFVFSTYSNNFDIVNFYLNNISLLEKFIFYFRHEARKLIETSNKNRFFLPQCIYSPLVGTNNKNGDTLKNNQNQFLQEIETKKYIIQATHRKISITRQELNIIQHITKGYTMKETARILNISPRTAESYLNNVRHKLGCSRRSDIIKKLSDYNHNIF